MEPKGRAIDTYTLPRRHNGEVKPSPQGISLQRLVMSERSEDIDVGLTSPLYPSGARI